MDTKSEAEPNEGDEDEYIDMEVSSSSSTSLIMSTQSREFEFLDISAPTTSADELFYNGKLLPFGHLPPRLRLVQQLSNQAQAQTQTQTQENKHSLGLSFTAPPTTTTTPFESPSQSCRVSCELNRHDYNNVFNWSSTEMSSSSCSFLTQQGAPQRKLFWLSKKMRLIKQSSLLAQKLRASRSFLKSLFTKSACSSDSVQETGNGATTLEGNQYVNFSKQSSIFDQIESLSSSSTSNNNNNNNSNTVLLHRRSFSGAIKRHCGGVKCMSSFISSSTSSSTSNCSSNSSSFSVKSDGFCELNLVKSHSRSDVMSLEIENAIEGAIAHCKNSQQEQQYIINTTTEPKGSGSSLLLKQKVGGCGDHVRPELRRI